MTLPNLKQYIYSALGDRSPEMTCVEARLNLMQATFLVLQTSPVLDDDVLMKGQQVFRTLFGTHFNEKSEVGVMKRYLLVNIIMQDQYQCFSYYYVDTGSTCAFSCKYLPVGDTW